MEDHDLADVRLGADATREAVDQDPVPNLLEKPGLAVPLAVTAVRGVVWWPVWLTLWW
jgi:hypothetical protein